ncbi:MAG TPA: hypothetical protein VNQ76_06415 [Planctomicrobium sp.]|nr:hypothetical protein [Planctomicrobium sp.]
MALSPHCAVPLRFPARHSLPWRSSSFIGLLFVFIVMSAGCGGSRSKGDRPATVRARGVVTYQGEPVTDAVVVFQPSTQGGFAASALTDQKGEFDLKTFPPDSGAVPGMYAVAILKVSQEDIYSEETQKASVARLRSLIPSQYSNASKSGLNVEIPPKGTEQLVFDLKD